MDRSFCVVGFFFLYVRLRIFTRSRASLKYRACVPKVPVVRIFTLGLLAAAPGAR